MPDPFPNLVWLSLAPLALVCATSFLKISVVLTLLRNALGTADVPGPGVVYGLALALTAVVMAPVATQVYDRAQARAGVDLREMPEDPEVLLEITQPWRKFLEAHTADDVRAQIATALPDAAEMPDAPHVTLAAFMISELKEAFSVGVLLFIPFLMVDLLVAYALSGLGLSGIHSQQLALPLKLMLFVAADGWTLVAAQLVKGYA